MVRTQSAVSGPNSLLSHLFNKARRRLAQAGLDQSVPADLKPLTMLDALVLLSGARGIETTATQLAVALPANEGDIANRFVPIALSRVGLEAQWRPLAGLAPQDVDLPLLAPLAAGGAVLIQGMAADGGAVVRDSSGERVLSFSLLRPLLSGEVLHTGPLDPINGASQTQERELIRRNPRLWLLAAYFGERRILGRMLLAAALLNLCALTIPLYMRAIYDRVVPNLAIESLWALSAGVVVALVFELLLKKLKSAHVDGIGVRVGQQRSIRRD